MGEPERVSQNERVAFFDSCKYFFYMDISKITNLPGVYSHEDGRVSFDITEEEQESTTRYFKMFKEPGKEVVVTAELKTMFDAMALYNYGMEEYSLIQHVDTIEPKEYTEIIFKIAAAILKANTIYSKNIFLFDIAYVLERIDERETARNFYELFLDKINQGTQNNKIENKANIICENYLNQIRAIHGLPELIGAQEYAKNKIDKK